MNDSHVVVEELLKLLVTEVDAELLKTEKQQLKTLKKKLLKPKRLQFINLIKVAKA